MICGAFAFALMASLTHALGDRCDWLVTALVRAVFMFGTALLLARTARVRLVVWDPPTLWVRSIAGSFSLVCNFYAMTRLPVADVLTLSNAYPLWIVILSALLLRQRPAAAEVVGVTCGLVGVVLIQQPLLAGDRLAVAVAVVGSFATAVAMLGLHRLRGIDTVAIVVHFSGVASLIAASWLALRHDVVTTEVLAPRTLLMLLAVGVSGTIGQFFLTKAYATGLPAEVAMVGLTQVVFGMGFDVAFWGRSMTPIALAGTALILAPTACLAVGAGRKLLGVSGPIEATPDAAPVGSATAGE
jgi:drug/metabolite transporter (DMT)-like permease